MWGTLWDLGQGSSWSVKGVSGLGSGAPASFEARPSGSPSVDKSVYVFLGELAR